jgi:sugar phosphate isomerase/epimerase
MESIPPPVGGTGTTLTESKKGMVNNMKLGAQLYTLREFCKTTEGLDETLRRVADMGYTSVQLSGVCEYDAGWMKEKLDAYGLTADITHYDYKKVAFDTEKTIAFHDKMNCRYIGIGGIPDFKKNGCRSEDFDKFVMEIAPALRKIAASGNHKFMYHNHNMEFAKAGGKTYLEKLCDIFPAEFCGITLDTYWAQAGGADPAQWLRKLKGRVMCVHYKDMVYNAADGAVRMAPIGYGNMNYEGIVEASLESGVEFAYVELDHCYGDDPFYCLKISYEYLKTLGLK